MCLDGTFVEFGARDGIQGSNSYFFENELHWSGLLVEGLKSDYKRLIVNRPNTQTIKRKGLLCSEPGEREYIWASGDVKYEGWGGFKEELIRSGALEAIMEAQKANPNLKISSKRMSCLSLNDLLDEAGMKAITLLSADCEGCELEVFSSLNWQDYSPTIILTEKAGDEKRLCQVIELLMSKGYTPVNWSSSDVIFVRNELVSKLHL
ncbi:FkbM family methyltransferase [archaeon]|nr:MAG: FkbM family methyltransferase [archaeon]